MRDRLLEPRQGWHRVARGLRRGLDGPHPAFGTPFPSGERRDGGEGGLAIPTGRDYTLPPRPLGAEFFSERLTENTLMLPLKAES